jgi:7-cyano-7-deazaguanine synthase
MSAKIVSERARLVVMGNGYAPSPRTAAVLLSGLDSAAALHWALDRYAPVMAIGFDYSQAGAELAASQVIAQRRGVIWERQPIVDIGDRSNDTGRTGAGVSRAFVPARNGLFAWHAANIVARRFPGGRVDIVLGCNLDDAAGFPDCRAQFLQELDRNVSMGLAGACDVRIRAPWVYMRKADIVAWAATRPLALEDARYSVSCYRGNRCGSCDACTLRAQAFADSGVSDGTEPPPTVHGGDPGREARQ